MRPSARAAWRTGRSSAARKSTAWQSRIGQYLVVLCRQFPERLVDGHEVAPRAFAPLLADRRDENVDHPRRPSRRSPCERRTRRRVRTAPIALSGSGALDCAGCRDRAGRPPPAPIRETRRRSGSESLTTTCSVCTTADPGSPRRSQAFDSTRCRTASTFDKILRRAADAIARSMSTALAAARPSASDTCLVV